MRLILTNFDKASGSYLTSTKLTVNFPAGVGGSTQRSINPPRLMKVSFDTSFYTINTRNQTFLINTLATPAGVSITMTPGNYSYTSFAAMLQTVITAALGVATTVSINADNGLMTLSTAATFIAMNLTGRPEQADILGFAATSSAATVASITGSFPVKCYLSAVYLSVSSIFHETQVLINSSNSSGEILKLPITVDAFSEQVYYADELSTIVDTRDGKAATIEKGYASAQQINSIDVVFFDQRGNEIDFNNGVFTVELDV